MKRLGVELNWGNTWRRLFHPNDDRVEVLEVVRVLKCDFEGLALVCRIKFQGDPKSVEDLAGHGALTNAELLSEEDDGSLVVFIQGSWPTRPGRPKSPDFHVTVEGTPEFLDAETQKVNIVGTEGDLARFLEFSKDRSDSVPFRLLSINSLMPGSESLLSRLTTKQRQAVLLGYALGYYEVPRRITSEKLAGRLNVGKSTLIEHLRKAQKRLMSAIVSG